MDITIQLTNSKALRFAVEGEASALELLRSIKPWEFFDHKIFMIQNGAFSSMINPGGIETVWFSAYSGFDLHPPENIVSLKCVSEGKYRQRLEKLRAKYQENSPTYQVTDTVEMVMGMTFPSGAIHFLDYLAVAKQQSDQIVSMATLFERPPMFIPCEDGGLLLVDFRKITCLEIYPLPPQTQLTAWRVDRSLAER